MSKSEDSQLRELMRGSGITMPVPFKTWLYRRMDKTWTAEDIDRIFAEIQKWDKFSGELMNANAERSKPDGPQEDRT